MNWHTILLESSEKKNNGKVVKPQRVIRGLCEIDGSLYYLDYVLFTNFQWWGAIKTTENYDIEALKNSTFEQYFNSETQTFVSFEDLPNNIKKLLC